MNEKEKSASIEYILSKGLIKPQSTVSRIFEMAASVGIRFIFWDMGYSLFFSALSLTMVIALFCLAPENLHRSAAVASAPMLLLLIALFAETSERASGIYELKQTCRYTTAQVTALRVICYSFAGAIFTAIIAAASSNGLSEFLSLFPLCLSALFLSAVVEMSVIHMQRGKWAAAFFPFCWIFINLILLLSLKEAWEGFLRRVPIAISSAFALLCIAIFCYLVSKMLSEANKYAVA